MEQASGRVRVGYIHPQPHPPTHGFSFSDQPLKRLALLLHLLIDSSISPHCRYEAYLSAAYNSRLHFTHGPMCTFKRYKLTVPFNLYSRLGAKAHDSEVHVPVGWRTRELGSSACIRPISALELHPPPYLLPIHHPISSLLAINSPSLMTVSLNT